MIRRSSRFIAVVLVASLFVPSVASAESVSALKRRLESLKSQTSAAGAAFSRAYWRLDETEVALDKTRTKLKKTEKRLSAAKRRLNSRADGIYRRDGLDLLQFLVGAGSFEEFVTRADYVQRVGRADAEMIADVKRLRRDLLAERRRLRAERTVRAKRLASLRQERDRLQGRLRAVEREFRAVKRKLDVARSGGRPLPAGIASVAGPNGMVFPVVGSYYYANTWGASRSGGRRRHQGTDIMARNGTPCVAVTSGSVTAKTNGLGGLTIWLRGDNGWSYYYAHLSRWAVRSGRVRAGQVVGYVGSTGNATASAPHLHFQMHPGGGGPTNPYPYLRAME